MRRAYPRAGVHFIPKGFVVPILETLQIMKARKLCTKWTHRNLLGARHLVITFGKMLGHLPGDRRSGSMLTSPRLIAKFLPLGAFS